MYIIPPSPQQEFVCYRYKKHIPDTYSFEIVAHSLMYSHTLFGIGLGSEFNECSSFLAIVYYGDYPFVSRDYTNLNNRLKGFDKTMRVNKYYLTFARVNFSLASFPFTSCRIGIKFRDKYICLRKCLNDRLQSIERVPFTEIITEPIASKHFNTFDLNNETSLNLLKASNKECYDLCDLEACSGDFTSTYITGNMDAAAPNISFRIRLPQAPLSIINSNPKMFIQDFLVSSRLSRCLVVKPCLMDTLFSILRFTLPVALVSGSESQSIIAIPFLFC